MKKTIVFALVITAVLTVAMIWALTPTAPDHYEIHHVKYGETLESIIQDSNKNTDVYYDIREAVTQAVIKSREIDGGATSRQLKVGDKVAVPIYR